MKLSPLTSGFVLSAAITVLFNTGLAWAKDAWPKLNDFMKSLAGHHWTTHGLFDLVLFAGLGLVLMKVRAVERMDPKVLTRVLVGSVAVASFGLGLWYVFV